jgi:HEPN domain-containing protein
VPSEVVLRDRVTEAWRWLLESREDLRVAQVLLQNRHYAAACFHAQQAAEKALKGVLYGMGERTVPVHSVHALLERATGFWPEARGFAEVGGLLDQFYTATRYPNDVPSPALPHRLYSRRQARTACRAAEAIVQAAEAFVRTHVGDVPHELLGK